MNDSDRLRMLAFLADSLDAQMQPESAANVRWAHRRLVEGAIYETGCERCGTVLEQKPVGRRRRFCSERCRKRAGNLRVVS